MTIELRLNGAPARLEAADDDLLVDVLRDRAGLTGTKEACGVGVCGACTVLLDERPVSSCTMLAGAVAGRDLYTVEGLAQRDRALIDAFVAFEGMQCGICTPGQVVSAFALGLDDPGASEEEIRAFMAGNLCRCTGYAAIIDAVRAYLGTR